MNKLVGIRWGSLSKETKDSLLKEALCIDGKTGNEIDEGECIVDLTDELSINGKIVDYEIIINDDSIIYNPNEGIILEQKSE